MQEHILILLMKFREVEILEDEATRDYVIGATTYADYAATMQRCYMTRSQLIAGMPSAE